MILKRKWFILFTIFIVLLFVSTSSFVIASTNFQRIDAYYGVQIMYNNRLLESTDKPFIVSGRTYVPLRVLMETFGDKDIQWDSSNSRVIINDQMSAMEQIYTQQILIRNKQIEDLKNEVYKLENQIALMELELEDLSLDLNDLEDELTDDYEDYEDLDLTITLSGDKDLIKLTVKLDDTDWDDVSTNRKENLLQDICDDIWHESKLEDAEIEGYVKDGSKTLEEFSVEADDDVELLDFDEKLDDFESELEDKYEDDWDDYDLPLRLYLSGDEDDIEFEIRFSLSSYDDEWNDLSDYRLKNLMDDLYDDLVDEYEDADVIGYVYDSSSNDVIAEYDGSDLTRD